MVRFCKVNSMLYTPTTFKESADAVARLNNEGIFGGRLSGGIFRNSASERQFAAAPVSNNQVLLSPCTLRVINGRAALSENVEQMLANEKELISSEQTDKTVGIK